jgi:hypothetical protein
MPKTRLISNLPEGKTTSQPLIERIIGHQIDISTEDLPQTNDRWVLVSNLQKSIRRGLVPTAVGTATKLMTVDPRYFWRRLMVVAYEDVGYGDINRCHDLLKTFRREALQRDLGPERVAQFFAHELATARKSRSLCDALAMLEFSVRREEYERQTFALTEPQLLARVYDTTLPFIARVAALRHICGYGTFANGRHQTLSPAHPALMMEVCKFLGLTEVESTLFRSGQNVVESLNIPIPMVSQMTRVSQQSEQQAEQRFEGGSGILYAALDRHTRAGKRSYARLAKDDTGLRRFFASRPAINPVTVLGVAMFIIEGAALDRWLVFNGSASLLDEFNQTFLEYAGVTGGDQAEILELARYSLEQLNHIRAREIR